MDGWAEGKTKGFIKTKSLRAWWDGWVGLQKLITDLDMRLCEKWLQGGVRF